MNPVQPPRLAERFFQWFCHQRHLEGLEGDLYERFEYTLQTEGASRARRSYVRDVLTLIRPSVARTLTSFIESNSTSMGILLNYFKTSLRAGNRNRWFSAINLVGLTLGITAVLFISLFVSDELTFDQHIQNVDQKFRIYDIREGEDGEINYLPIVPPAFAPRLAENFDQIEAIGRMMFDYGGTVFYIDDEAYKEEDGVYMESDVLDITDIRLIEGDIERWDEPHQVLLSQRLYQKFFGDAPYSKQTVSLGRTELVVSGIFEDLPAQSHLELEYIYPFRFAVSSVSEERMNSWVWQQFYTYLQVKEGANMEVLEKEIQDFVKETSNAKLADFGFFYTPYLQPIRDIHLHSSNFEWDIAVRGNYQSILFLSFAAFIILLIACLNFVNLTSAQAVKRAKEASVRRFIGARKRQLVVQHVLEALMYTFVAGLISIGLLLLGLPFFESFSEKSFRLSSIFTAVNIAMLTGVLFVLGVLSGLYPAAVILSYKPLQILHGLNTSPVRSRINIRQLMVGMQYVLSTGLIILALVIQKQYDYLQTADMGFNKDNLMVIPMTRNMRTDLETLKTRFSDHSNIVDITFSYGIPGGIVSGDGVLLPHKNNREFSCNMFMVDEYYIPTMGMDLVAGRNFDPERATDATEAFVLNETAAKNFGFESPEEAIGEPVHWIVWGTEDSLKVGEVIGVVRDFNFKSLHNEMSSTVLHMGESYFQNIIVRAGDGDLQSTIKHLEAAYATMEPKRPMDLTFIDQSFEKYYKAEQKLSWLFTLFTFLAILTASIGLFGLVSFHVLNRSKEISIRKVLGAEVSSVLSLLVSRYFVLVLVCMVVAIPLAYVLADKWLSNFAFKVELGAWLYIEVVFITLILTIVTVGYQAYKGAVANPASKLRSE